MTPPERAIDYQEREIKAAFSVLVELGQVLGAYHDKFVVVGGAVPWLLLGDATPKHIGTLDIDLALDPEALSDGEYATLVETLEDAGYERGVEGLKDFQLRRWVKAKDGPVIAVIVDLLMPRTVKLKRRKKKLVEQLRVQRVDGAEIAFTERIDKSFTGAMPDGRNNTVNLLVATIPASLIMKGYALAGRNKKKDAYDIYFSVRNYRPGIAELARVCVRLLNDPIAKTGFEHIAAKFKHPDDFGPTTVRAFLEESAALGDMTPDQVQMDAFGQVSEFLKALGI